MLGVLRLCRVPQYSMSLIRNYVTDIKMATVVGTLVKFAWVTMGRKILNDNISAKKEDIKL